MTPRRWHRGGWLAAVLLALAALAALWLRWGEAVFLNQLGAMLC
ncbi:hypothetical protein [Tahibacter harae]|uniref:Uncharacterized protein n=1 Tax=Tahibacter harae TaxID=2963937 RepID=A0ABT1QP08_9GAMM|nr:hypothetical protein [Tahibacter harae]MCQ4163650.1 hypothetical protein [Tahibacter harae]